MPPKIFHISEKAGIKVFVPRPSPSDFENVTTHVVFGIGEDLLHHYLLPRDCPRVCFYASKHTSKEDKQFFLRNGITHKMFIRKDWQEKIDNTVLHCYEFNPDNFKLIDPVAQYFVSEKVEVPIRETKMDNLLQKLSEQEGLEIELVPDLTEIAAAVASSSLGFSIIRMRNNWTPEHTG